eukprot:TRINITY_DN63738_c0_g1_i1.p1 TRINITY_DN63738_c0_g1~~TRINITY_DN63738_c0_g1_i1.p1  ORF type:complete len:506 (+),score=152.22 TRINITY_DN63738_c0_g1_i1:243-1760(+)
MALGTDDRVETGIVPGGTPEPESPPAVADPAAASRRLSTKDDAKYNESTCIGRFAQSRFFEYATLSVIFANAIWMGIDAEFNHAKSLQTTAVGFIVGENLFCTYFFFEIIVRLIAYREKQKIIRDGWFLFDSFLVTVYVVETWLLPLFSGSQGNFIEKLGFLKLMRLLRLTRLIRLMRSVPELLTIVKGILAATRSVGSVLLFLSILAYVFGIFFTSTYKAQEGDPVASSDEPCEVWQDGGATPRQCLQKAFFGDLGTSLFTLLCSGTLLDDVAGLVVTIREDSIIMLFVFFAYIMLSSFTVLNMLIGILCEVVTTTQAEEGEKQRFKAVREVILEAFTAIDTDGSLRISANEFATLCKDEAVLETLEKELGIDRASFVEAKELIFEGSDGNRASAFGGELSFHAFVNLVMRLRPTQQASPMDVHSFMKATTEQERLVARHARTLQGNVAALRRTLKTSGLVGDGPAAAQAAVECAARATDEELMREVRRRFGQESWVGSAVPAG